VPNREAEMGCVKQCSETVASEIWRGLNLAFSIQVADWRLGIIFHPSC